MDYMLTAVLHDFDRLVLEERPVPQPGPDDALVRIKSCGICATDYKAIKGIRRNVRFPLVPGHEPAGVVNPEKVISHRFPLTEIAKAMEVMGTPGRNKVVINP
jgi:threonine dehydrogenase-like Zn-dependent dehydrogenase